MVGTKLRPLHVILRPRYKIEVAHSSVSLALLAPQLQCY